jgi:hypothetical protein
MVASFLHPPVPNVMLADICCGVHVAHLPCAGIRGTKHIHDVLTDLCSSSTPFAGGQVHWGMWQAAQLLLCNELPRLARLSSSHPGLVVTVLC